MPKKILFFLTVIMGIFWFFLSCESPFTKKYDDIASLTQLHANNPSLVALAAPFGSKNVVLTAPLYTNRSLEPGTLQAESSIRGEIYDKQGIKPGYPKIQIWKSGDPAPDPYDEATYATLFLSGYDNPEALNGSGAGTYTDRNGLPRVSSAQFVFPLYEFDLVPDYYQDMQISYKISAGKRIPYPEGTVLNFRIKTSDAFEGEGQAKGFFPPSGWGSLSENPAEPGDPVSVQLVSSSDSVVIRIDNDDVQPEEKLQAYPNTYIVDGVINRKIDRFEGEREFRFQILGTHSSGIQSATLHFSHPSSGRSWLPLSWDIDRGGANGVDKGGEGKVFTYTYFSGGKGYKGNGETFYPSTEPYTLMATVYATGGAISSTFSQELYIDGSGPAVRIQFVKGAVSRPVSVPYGSTEDTAENNAPYIVNGNVQFAVSFFDDIDGTNYPMVKWVVEETSPGATGSIRSKINNFRAALTKDDLKFFEDIGESYASGWVRPPQDNAPVAAPVAAAEDRSWNFKFNTRNELTPGVNAWDGKDLYVYVIAQDNARNLGYVLQKVHVDDSLDKPMLSVPGLFVGIDHQSKLDVVFKDDPPYDNEGNWNPRRNILEQDRGIALYLTDDDGISRTQSGVQIYLTDLNGRLSARRQFSTDLVQRTFASGNSKDWRGTLSQAIMAEALYGTGASAHLPDGLYKLEIAVRDDVGSKVSISRAPGRPGDTPATVSAEPQVYFFAVFTEPPVITFNAETPQENLLVSGTRLQLISGTVKSRLQVKHLSITFTPDIIRNSTGPLVLDLVNEQRGTDYYYTYNWKVPTGVSFAPSWLNDPRDSRNFRVDAYDRLGNMSSESRTVKVDKRIAER